MEERVTRRYQALMIVFAVIISMALTGGGFALYDRFEETNYRRAAQQEVNRQLQEADRRQIGAMRTVLCLARAEVLMRDDFTADERKRAIDFYDRALVKIHALPCDDS